jgi:decaprenylphospho-beta-D-ribofuranose 2-oxidase
MATALPTTAEECCEVVGRFNDRPSLVLVVLKRFRTCTPGRCRSRSRGHLSDIAASVKSRPFLGALDRRVEAGGRIYLAKDSRMDPDLLDTMYPRVDEWRKVATGWTRPHLASDQSRPRLGG